MLFDFDRIPFSRADRFLTLSRMADGDGQRATWLRHVSGGDERPSLGRLCRLSFLDAEGRTIEPRYRLEPTRLIAETDGGEVEFVIGKGETLHIRGRSLGLLLELKGSRYDYAFRTPAGEDCVVASGENLKIRPVASGTALDVGGQWRRDHAEDVFVRFHPAPAWEGSLALFEVVPPVERPSSFDAARADAEADFADWLRRMPKARAGEEEVHRLACTLLWANRVPPRGLLTRPSIYMSKNWMINIWSWDNAFSALGVHRADPELAFDQFAAIFDHQHESGCLPDFVNDRHLLFAFTKPPVHGWAVRLIHEDNPAFLTPERRRYLARAIAAQVDYWLTHTRADEEGLPTYFHGNDSGWDNATFFAEGGPVMSPDLPVFLILACDTLADLLLDEPDAIDHYRQKAETLLTLLKEWLWDGEQFRARLLSDPDRALPGQSLVQFMPLLLGSRLSSSMKRSMMACLQEGGFITQRGLATESTQSPHYEADGYWRGPIWAPTTLLVWDGLRRQGETGLADEIARRFCRMAAENGLAENFDAQTGRGLRDPAFAWTSAAYLLLASSLGGGGT